MDSVQMDGRILTGKDGQGVLITDVKIVEVTKNDGELKARLVVAGKATDYLNNPKNPDDGTTALDEEIECSEGIDLEQEDKQLFFDKINRHFKVDPPLVDSEEDLFRLVEGGDAHDQIAGKKVFFRYAHSKGSEDSKYGVKFFTNMVNLPKNTAATSDSLKEVLARLRAKQDAKNRGLEEANEALEAVLGN